MPPDVDIGTPARPYSALAPDLGLPPRLAGPQPSPTGAAAVPEPEGATLHQMNTSWRDKAACHGLDPQTFYPETDEEAEEAKAVCGVCPVQTLCLEYALVRREKEGVWGGCTERERRRIIRQRRRTA